MPSASLCICNVFADVMSLQMYAFADVCLLGITHMLKHNFTMKFEHDI